MADVPSWKASTCELRHLENSCCIAFCAASSHCWLVAEFTTNRTRNRNFITRDGRVDGVLFHHDDIFAHDRYQSLSMSVCPSRFDCSSCSIFRRWDDPAIIMHEEEGKYAKSQQCVGSKKGKWSSSSSILRERERFLLKSDASFNNAALQDTLTELEWKIFDEKKALFLLLSLLDSSRHPVGTFFESHCKHFLKLFLFFVSDSRLSCSTFQSITLWILNEW